MQKKVEKEKDTTELNTLNKVFTSIRTENLLKFDDSFGRRNQQTSSRKVREYDDFDSIARSMSLEAKAKASDRVKTAEECKFIVRIHKLQDNNRACK